MKILNYLKVFIILFLLFFSCKRNRKNNKRNADSLLLKKREAGNINNQLFTALEDAENEYIVKVINKRIKELETKANKNYKEKTELIILKKDLVKLNTFKKQVKQNFEKLNIAKIRNNNDNSNQNAFQIIKEFCRELKNIKSNKTKKNKDSSIGKSANIENYLSDIMGFEDNDESSWDNFIDDNLKNNFNNIFEATKLTINKNNKTKNSFNNDINNTILSSSNLINCYLDILKNTELKNHILNPLIGNKKQQTKFIGIIEMALSMFEKEIIKPLKLGYDEIKKQNKLSINMKKDYKEIKFKFLEYKKLFEKYKKSDPNGKAIKQMVEIFQSDKNYFLDISECIFSTIVFIMEFKDLLSIILEERKNTQNNKIGNKIKEMVTNDIKWKKVIGNMADYIKAMKKISEFKNFINKAKIKIKSINNKNIKLLIDITQKEFEIATKFFEILKNDRILILEAYMNK
ncbi:MAG: hypothetical protein GY830_10570 [Bacteroidetes bacterium]|nr:hypothetical protein [Bacteroidota bacterium]